jgi:glycosyltransferase involved in cell wall biosynthesis
MPKVSVIIPNYNHAPYLRQRIDSVLGQTCQDFEVILLDDCSTDNSRSIISEYASDPRVKIEFNETNSGSTFKQWDKGMRLARGEYIWMAESDDYAEERLLERLVKVLDEEPDVTFAYCRSWRITPEGQRNGFADSYLARFEPGRWATDFRADGREECRNWFVFANSVPNASCAVFKKAVYDRIGGVDQNMRVSGDWKLWAAMAFEGRIAYVAEPLNYYREHDATVRIKSRESGLLGAEQLAMLRWMLERVTPTGPVLNRTYAWAAPTWVEPLFSRRLPFRARWGLLRDAVATDPHALRRVVEEILTRVRLKTRKELGLFRRRFQGTRKSTSE